MSTNKISIVAAAILVIMVFVLGGIIVWTLFFGIASPPTEQETSNLETEIERLTYESQEITDDELSLMFLNELVQNADSLELTIRSDETGSSYSFTVKSGTIDENKGLK